MTLFVDEDGTGYLLHSSEDNWTLYIAELNEDYTGLTGNYSRNYVSKNGSKGVYAREAPAIFKYQGSYYLISSGCTGWRPNVMGYSVTDNLRQGMSKEGGNGPFQMDNLKNPCVGEDANISFGGQSTFVLLVQGKEGCFIYMGDKWNANNLKDSRYQWLPIQLDSANKALTISWSDSWKLEDFTNLSSRERAELNEVVREAQELSAQEYDFGQARWKSLQKLIADAVALPYSATPQILSGRKAALLEAVEEVKKWKTLDEAFSQVENSAEAVYTPESWKAVKEAYDSGKLLKADASPEQIQAAADAITAAASKLQAVEMVTEELSLLGKRVIADTQHSGNEAEKAIDGNSGTFWHCEWGGSSSPLPHSLTIDLGDSYENLYQLSYLPRQDKDSNGITIRYRILVSNAAKDLSALTSSDFQEVRTGTWAEDKSEKSTVFRTSGAARFVRFEVVEGVGGFASAAELRLFTGIPKEDPDPDKPDPDKPEPEPEQPVLVKKISISAPSVKIAAGKKVKLTASAVPKNAKNQKVKWSTSNQKYAVVNSKGVVTTRKAGKGKNVIITATAKDGSKVKKSIRIKIMKDAVKKITITNAPKRMKAGEKVTLKAKVTATGQSANKALKWTSSNNKYASVTSSGKVTARKAGKGRKVVIRAVSTDGTSREASVTIKIR